MAAQEFFSRASVVDGDTLIVEGQPKRVRLFGINAPESSPVCTDAADNRFLSGGTAAEYLAALIGQNGRVERDRDRYGRVVASCSIDGRDIGDAMVAAVGRSITPATFRGRYEAAKVEARSDKRRLWAGDFKEPWAWRAKRGRRYSTPR